MHTRQYKICNLDEISDPGAKGFSLFQKTGVMEKSLEGILVRCHLGLFAYVNQCPHTGVNLNWMPDVFLSPDQQFIQCSMHGALFRLEDGLCVRGPCLNSNLQALTVTVKSSEIWVRTNNMDI